ncbi:hypothetical protein [Metabacillus malikii]|uniref:Uncharacterized protein n=2 Tax=Bacillaceae TaxID=186817 RepID=A0ABT9ZJF8_9BACI|nr:hypothetical protein [Metabacillus malikii]MDQ0232422.1 hypothetical protein [Metabacillus malikii]
MGVSLFLILISIFSLSVLVIYKVTYHRKKFTNMTGMMIAMSIGMSVGLTVGVIVGIVISDNFFIATILGMAAGFLIGFLTGLPVSIIAVLDGMLSGIMGGMMGAMLGEMITVEYRDAIVKIMIFLFLSTLLILLHLIQKEVSNKEATFYNHPLFIIILYSFIFILLNQLDPIFSDIEAPNEQNHIEHH